MIGLLDHLHVARDKYHGQCHPTDAMLAKTCRMSERSVSRGVAEAKIAGLITKKRRRGAPVYSFAFDLLDDPPTVADLFDQDDSPTVADLKKDEPPLLTGRSANPGGDDPSTGGESIRQRREQRREQRTDSCVIAEAFSAFCDLATELNLPKPKQLTKERARKLNARLQEHGPGAWQTVLDAIAASAFLCGGGDRGWQINFDWLVSPKNFDKVISGNYADRGSLTERNGFMAACAEFAQGGRHDD